ncbi:hypothetical protein D3C85_961840 [compost metagenome]
MRRVAVDDGGLVAALQKIHGDEVGGDDRRDLWRQERQREACTPELTLRIPAIVERNCPGIFVEVIASLWHCMALAWREFRFDNPDAVQFPTHRFGVQMVAAHHVLWFLLDKAIQVVRDQQLFLAYDFEFEAVHRTQKEGHFIHEGIAGSCGVRRVVGEVRGLAHTALTDEILPSLPVHSHLIDGVAYQDRFTGLERRFQSDLIVIPVLSGKLLRGPILVVVGVVDLAADRGGQCHTPSG